MNRKLLRTNIDIRTEWFLIKVALPMEEKDQRDTFFNALSELLSWILLKYLVLYTRTLDVVAV